MENIEAKKIINKMQQEILKNGIVAANIAKSLKELRPYAIEENKPTLTKVIRLTYEHLEQYNSFNIPIPADEVIEGFEDEFEEQNSIEDDFEAKRESLLYLLSLMANDELKNNKEDLTLYRDALLNY